MSKIDLNQADLETLAQLNGIGDKLAARIIDYRETVHPFEETIELAAVPGISERMVRALADEITVEPPFQPEEAAEPGEQIGELATTAAVVAGGTPEAEREVTGAVSPVAGPAEAAEEAEDAPATAVEAAQEEAAQEEAAQEEAAQEEAEEAEAEEEIPSEEEIVLLAEAGAGEEEAEEEKLEDEELPFPSAEAVPDEVLPAEADLRAAEPAGERPPEEEAEEAPPPPPRARASCFGQLLAIFFGALLGAGLTLLLLYALNGTLDFASPAQVARVQSEVAAQAEGQSGLSETLSALSTDVSRAAAAEATTTAGLAEMAGEMAEMERELAGDVASLETETEALATRVGGLSEAAENFDLFLDGMRNLLIELRGLPPLPTVTPTQTMTVTATTAAEETPLPAGTATPTPVTTRTPRPTATPFISASPTAANIP